MSNKILLTKNGYKRYEKELEELKNKEPDIIKEVQRTAAMGDRSENAGYQNAKRQLKSTQRRIFYLERLLKAAKVIETTDKDKVDIGSTVSLVNTKTKEALTYSIVDAREIDLEKNMISYNSPIGKSVLNKKVGDKAVINIEGKESTYKITGID